MVTASDMGKKGGQATSEAKAAAARKNAAQPRGKALPQWMTKIPCHVQHQGQTLADAAKVVREFARQVRHDGHKEFARHAIRIAESLECSGDGSMTWAQAFELDLNKEAPARRWRE